MLAQFKKYRNKLNSDLKKAKCDYHQNKYLHIHNDHKKVWDMKNNLTNRKQAHSSVKEIMIDNVNVIGKELADEMNRHFVNIGRYTGENADLKKCAPGKNQLESIMLFPTTPVEID